MVTKHRGEHAWLCDDAILWGGEPQPVIFVVTKNYLPFRELFADGFLVAHAQTCVRNARAEWRVP